MKTFNKSNLENIRNIFEEKTGVELPTARPPRVPFKAAFILAALLVFTLTTTAFAVDFFSPLSGDELSLSASYLGYGIVAVDVENRSDKELVFEEQLKLMRWSDSAEILPYSNNISFIGTKISAHTSGSMLIDLSSAYDLGVLEEPLVDDHYYFVLTNDRFLFGQDWMCSVKFAEPIITEKPALTLLSPNEADAASVSEITEELRQYFDACIRDPEQMRIRNERYFADCERLLSVFDGNIVSPVSPFLLVDFREPCVIFDRTVPADAQHRLTGEHHLPFDGYNMPVGASPTDLALVISALVPQYKDETDGGIEIPVIYIMTYEVSAVLGDDAYAFIRGRLISFADMEQYRVFTDDRYVCYNVTPLFYTDIKNQIESMISQRSDIYFDEQVWERVQNIYSFCMDKSTLESRFFYVDSN